MNIFCIYDAISIVQDNSLELLPWLTRYQSFTIETFGSNPIFLHSAYPLGLGKLRKVSVRVRIAEE